MAHRVPRRTLRELTGQSNEPRPNAAARGYGYRWQKYADNYLRKHPLCVRCQAVGRSEIARAVDHVTPVSGADDRRFWDTTNHQGLCFSCHAVKTNTEDRGKGRRERR